MLEESSVAAFNGATSGPLDDAGLPAQPPHSVQAEQSVLGALLLDNTCVAVVGDVLEPEAFFVRAHQLVFGAVMALLKSGQPADVVTVFEALHSGGQADDCGGLAYLNDLASCVVTARNARAHADLIGEKAHERALIAAAALAQQISWDTKLSTQDRAELIAGAFSRLEHQRKGPRRRVPVLRLDALRAEAAAVRWAIKHVVPAAAVGMMFGGSGTFKSFIALDMALHVAHGLPWMGRLTTPGDVLYIAAEGGAGMWARIDAWHRARQLKWKQAPFYVVPTAVDLTVDAWRVVDAALAIGVRPAMLVIDTLSQTYSGEENSANEMAAYLREIGLRFRQLWGCAVVLVHHTGHAATERPRGSSAIRANLDFLLSVFRDEKEMLATLGCVKQKDGEPFKDAHFQLSQIKLGADHDGDEVTSLVARHLSSEDAVMAARQAEQDAGRGGRQNVFLSLVQSGMTVQNLRREYYETLPSDMKQDTKKKMFYRAMEAAKESVQIDVDREMGIVIDLRKGHK